MAQLIIGSCYWFKRKKQDVAKLVYITSGSYLGGNGGISNCWTGRTVKENGKLGREIQLLYLANSQFVLNDNVNIIVVHKKVRKYVKY